MKNHKIKCSECNAEASHVTKIIDASTRQSQYLCDRCFLSRDNNSHSIDELDKQLTTAEATYRLVESNLADDSVADEEDEQLPAAFFTPHRLLDTSRVMLTELRSRRKQMLDSMSKSDRLEYELRKAITAQDYEAAAKIRDQLSDLNDIGPSPDTK